MYLVSSDGSVLELFGDHEGGVVVLEEPLLVQPRVEAGQGFSATINVDLEKQKEKFQNLKKSLIDERQFKTKIIRKLLQLKFFFVKLKNIFEHLIVIGIWF